MNKRVAIDAQVADRNNGDAVPPALVAEIAAARGPASDDSWWADQDECPGRHFPDDAVDWVEATANDEESL